MMRRPLAIGAALALTVALGGCSVVDGAAGTYPMTAYFPSTASLYEQSRVKVMGVDVGTIRSIKVEKDRVRVDFTVDEKVSVPPDVRATVMSANTLGERHIVLHPVWKSGMPKAPAGTVIPQERTDLPVEIDEALEAFGRLNRAIDPKQLGDAVHAGADAVQGHGADINEGLRTTAELADGLAGQDKRIVGLAADLRDLAASLNRKDRQLGTLIDSFAATSRTLAAERAELERFVRNLSAVIRKSDVLITAYEETLPGTVADLSNVVMTLKANSGSLNQTIAGLSRFAEVAVAAWDKENHVATVRLVLNATLRAWLQPVFTAMGWGTVPCPTGNRAIANCQGGSGG